MWVVIDNRNDKVIAYHETKRAVESYVNTIFRLHGITLKTKKKKNRYLNMVDPDLYLVKYGDTFLQSGYIMYMRIIGADVLIDDEEDTKDVLLRILELGKFKRKDEKAIKRVIHILDKAMKDEMNNIPSFDELKQIKDDLDPYIYNYQFGE